MQLDSLTRAATDLTLFFGAESFISQCSGEDVFDPDGERCLSTLIDLIVNCDSLGITLPTAKQHNPSKLLPLLSDYFSELPDGMLTLRSQTEDAVAKQFTEFAQARSWDWFSRWTTFQLTSSIVTNGHALRLGGTIVSPEGLTAWRKASHEIVETLNWPPLVSPMKLPAFVQDHMHGLSLQEFPLCYAFDVYRRGWQYVERVRRLNDGSAYVPHSLRGNCLDNTATWTAVEFRQNNLWSWGKYICTALRDDKLPALRTPEAVVGMVNRIKKVMTKSHGCPTWDASRIISAQMELADQDYIKEIQEWVKETAREANLPLLNRPHRAAEAISELTLLAVDKGLSTLEQLLGWTVLLPFTLAKIAGGVVAPETVAKVDTLVEVKKRQVRSWLFRASIDYNPLIPPAKDAK